MCLFFTVHRGQKEKEVSKGRGEDGKREGAMFVVGNPLKRGNTSMYAHTHIYIHTCRCKNIESAEKIPENKDPLCMS